MESANDVMRAIAWLLMIMMALEVGCMGLEFNMKSFSSDNISSWNDSSIASDVISLTSETWDGNSVGRVLYNQPIPLWTNVNNSRQRASFGTSFLFQIFSTNFSDTGDGMAFLMSGEHTPAPRNSTSDGLGILDRSLNGQASNNIIAVEFDTYRDAKYGDVDFNHVGIDVNSLNSTATRSLDDLRIDLGYDVKLTSWIDYDGNSMILSVYIASLPFSKPVLPFISQLIDLSLYLPQHIFIGFSAGTYSYVEFHQIYSWQFNITDLPTFNAVNTTLAPTHGLAPPPGLIVPTLKPIDTSGSSFTVGAIVGIVLAFVFFILLLSGIIFLFIRRKGKNGPRQGKTEHERGEVEISVYGGPRRFTYKEIRTATRNFSEENYLGRGGFGPVHKGILPNVGTPVAIKSIGQNSQQGEKEFMAEVNIISGIRHRNLLTLQGWCHEKGQFFLVYDYMPNGSLDQHLFKADIRKNPLEWSQRQKIVCGLAAGLQYLHDGWEKQVIHRDIKSANVMLDQNFNARLGDFGLARLADHNQMMQTTMAAGTFGYLPPEVAETGKATSASDVYSFGAVALEVACGRSVLNYNAPTPSQVRLAEWVWELHSKGMLFEAADPRLDGYYNKEEMERMLCLGLACSHPDPACRPTMREVHECLLNYNTPIPQISASMPRVYAKSFHGPGTISESSTSMSSNNNTSATLSSSSGSHFGPGPR